MKFSVDSTKLASLLQNLDTRKKKKEKERRGNLYMYVEQS